MGGSGSHWILLRYDMGSEVGFAKASPPFDPRAAPTIEALDLRSAPAVTHPSIASMAGGRQR